MVKIRTLKYNANTSKSFVLSDGKPANPLISSKNALIFFFRKMNQIKGLGLYICNSFMLEV